MNHFKLLTIYGFTTLFNALVSFATFSFLTHYLSESDYGIISLYTSLLAFLLPFIAVGAQYIISIEYFKLSAEAFRKHFVNGITTPVFTALIFTLLFLIANQAIRKLVNLNFFFAVTVPLACFLTIIVDIFLTLLRNSGQHKLFMGFSMLKNSIEAGLVILLVTAFNYQWEGRLGASLLTLMASFLFIGYKLYKWKYNMLLINKEEVITNLKAGLPFIPERLAIFVLLGSDRFFINHFSGISKVGLYGAGAQLAVIISLGISILNTAFHPYLYRNLELREPEYKKIKKTTFAYIGLSAMITVIVILLTPVFFDYFVGPLFQEGQVYAINLIIGLFFWSIYNTFLPFLLIQKRNKLVMNISITGMILSITLNYFNVGYFGALGATYTSILVYFLMASITLFFVHKFYDLKKVFS